MGGIQTRIQLASGPSLAVLRRSRRRRQTKGVSLTHSWRQSHSLKLSLLTCLMSKLCASDANEIALTISATRLIAILTSLIVVPASTACRAPSRTIDVESSISALISFAAVAERCARLRTSVATTAKPRPWSASQSPPDQARISRRCAPARSIASTAAGRTPAISMKPWTIPCTSTYSAGTPAACNALQ